MRKWLQNLPFGVYSVLLSLGVGIVLWATDITDEKYATSVSVIGGRLLFAPGSPRTVRAGIQFDF